MVFTHKRPYDDRMVVIPVESHKPNCPAIGASVHVFIFFYQSHGTVFWRTAKGSCRKGVCHNLHGAGIFLFNSGNLAHKVNNCLLYTSPSPRDGLLSRM